MTSAMDELKAAIAAGNAVIVAGTGVSVAAMAGEAPLVTWKGLLLDGLSHCKDIDPDSSTMIDALTTSLSGKPKAKDFLRAATEIETTMKDSGRYTAWLNDCLEGLKPTRPELIDAMGTVGAPILTTNYDTLIARTLGRDAVAWTNADQLGKVARGETRQILHLHGVYNQADSVVLGWPSYTKVADHTPSALLKHAIGLMKSFVFIGCGVDGLTDPDLGPFFKTYGAIFGTGRHFRICHKDEAAATPHGIKAVTYDDHGKLAELLRGLAPPAKAVAAPRPAYRLERPPEHFVGRDAQRELLRDRLLAGQPTLVTGPAGMGKSALCLTALHHPEVEAKYGQLRWFIRLDGATTAATMMAMVGEALGLPAEQRRAESVRHALAQSPGALVLDNFETPWHGDRKEAETELAHLRALPDLALAVGVRGSGSLPAPCPPWLEVAVGALGASDALDLFQSWTNHRFDGDADQGVLVADTKGWPLALVLLAREAAPLPRLAKLLERWREARAKAQDEIGAAVEVSLGSPRITDDAGILASLLGRLPDGVAVEDLDTILPEQGEEAGGVLVGLGLAQWSEARDRLLVLAPIRQHLEHAHPPAEPHWAPCRDHYLGLAEAADGPADAKVLARLTPDAGNVAAVVTKDLDDNAKTERALKALVGFGEFFRFTGLGGAVPLLRQVAEMGLGERATAECLLSLGMIAVGRSGAEAKVLLTQACEMFACLGDLIWEAKCLFWLGTLALRQNRWDEAEQCFARAEAGFGRKAPLGTANCRFNRAVLALHQGQVAASVTLFCDALGRYRRLGDDLGQGNALFRLAVCAHQQNKKDQADKYLTQAFPLLQAAGNIQSAANCHFLEADMALRRNDLEGTLAAVALALPLYERAGDPLGQGNSWRYRGFCAAGQGDAKVARRHFAKALDLFARIPDPRSIAVVKADLARIAAGKERKTLVAEARAAYVQLGLEADIRSLDERFPDLAPRA